MQLALDPHEQETSVWALNSAVSDLGAEIADTENQEFREDLKKRKAILLGILDRLNKEMGGPAHSLTATNWTERKR
jgi:hypothetical protein